MEFDTAEEVNAAEGLLRLSKLSSLQDTNDNHSARTSDSTITMDDPMDIDTPDEDRGECYREQHPPSRPASSSVSRRAQVRNGSRQELSGRIHPAHTRSANPTQLTPPREMTPDQALQAYLIHQQLLAGIAPEDVIPMRGQRRGQPAVPRTNQPTLLRINNEGVFVPSNIPPARFTGVIRSPAPVNMVCSARFPAFANNQAPPTNRIAIPTTPPAPVQPPQISRTLPQIPSHESAQPARPLDALPGTQPDWDSRIPRIAELHHTSPVVNNSSTSEQQARVVLPSVDELLQGVPPPPQTVLKPASPPFKPRESDEMPGSTTPEVNQELAPSSPNRKFEAAASALEAVDIESELSSPPATMSTKLDSSNDIDIPVVPGFNLLQALVDNTKVAMALTDNLNVKDIIKLMVTFRPFYDFVKTHESAIATRKAYNEALQAARACPPVCYPSLCVPSTEDPSLRWLAMVTFREHAAEEIVKAMGESGYDLPWQCADMLKKLWFLFDIPDNKRRVWTVQNVNLWPDISIYYFMRFYIRVDEYVVTKYDNQTGGLRRLAMAQPSLSFWLKVLKNRRFHTQLDILQTFVRWQYKPQPHEAGGIVFGLEPEEVGLLQYEYYGRRGERTVKIERPDTCVMKELQRRNISMQQMHLDLHYGQGGRYNNVTVQNSTWDYEVRRHSTDDDAPDWVKGLQMNLEA